MNIHTGLYMEYTGPQCPCICLAYTGLYYMHTDNMLTADNMLAAEGRCDCVPSTCLGTRFAVFAVGIWKNKVC